jgi:signal transduction histidine kinase
MRRLLLSYFLFGLMILLFAPLTVRTAQAQTIDPLAERLPLVLADYYNRHGSWAEVQIRLEELAYFTDSSLTLINNSGEIIATSTTKSLETPHMVSPILDASNHQLGAVLYIPIKFHQTKPEKYLDMGLFSLIVLILAGSIGIVVNRSINRSLVMLKTAMIKVATGELSVKLPPTKKTEFSGLFHNFNLMLNGLERDRKKFIANVTHDMRLPLTVIKGYLEGLLTNQISDRRSAQQAFEAMNGELLRLLAMVERTPVKKPSPNQTVIKTLLEHTVVRLKPMAPQVEFNLNVSPEVTTVWLDKFLIERGLLNLLDNSLRHNSTEIYLSAYILDNKFRLQIKDNGTGIPPEHLDYIFEPYYVVGRAGQTGLGLAIVRDIVQAHGGTITVASSAQGTIFKIDLPL